MEGYFALAPEDYIPYFKKKNVTLVIRFNKKYYDARRFTSQGIDHSELYFLDGTNPPEHILYRFLQLCEETPGPPMIQLLPPAHSPFRSCGSSLQSWIRSHRNLHRMLHDETPPTDWSPLRPPPTPPSLSISPHLPPPACLPAPSQLRKQLAGFVSFAQGQ
jgi:hypothetical protein